MCVLPMNLLKRKWERNLTIMSPQYMCIEKDYLRKILRINITNEDRTMCVFQMNLIKVKWERNLTIMSPQCMCIEKDHL